MPTVTFGCVGDVHGALDRLGRAAGWLASRGADALLLTGDFTPGIPPGWARPDAEADPLAPVRHGLERARRAGLPVYFVPGNHDVPEAPIDGNVDRRAAAFDGVTIFGLGGSGPARMGFPYEWADEEIDRLDVPDRQLLLTHAPPAETTLDRTASGRHAGSRAVRRLAAETQGALVCGHIHESAGVERLGGCLCYNVGALGGAFGRLQAGTLEIDDAGRARARHYVEEGGEWRPGPEGSHRDEPA